ncbi:MAG: hypothetical protein ACPLY7_02265 [Microgenomates group bacterium]
MLVGTISGTYSSTFTAAPLLVVWKELKESQGSIKKFFFKAQKYSAKL